MRLAWTTDPHLNHVPMTAWEQWLAELFGCRPDGLLITGDISESDDVAFQLRRLAESLAVPIYFVLGNHDFYRRTIAETRRAIIEACRETRHLHYLTDCAPIELGENLFLVGEDGWGDAKLGDYEGSPVRLNDFRLIHDFQRADPADWKAMLIREGEVCAARLQAKLVALPTSARHVVIATHVPPFREACWYEGHTTDDLWAPFFVCGAVGDVLTEVSRRHPECQFRVLCGHTHHRGTATLADNLIVHTGAAEYGQPALEAVLDLEPGNSRFRAGLEEPLP